MVKYNLYDLEDIQGFSPLLILFMVKLTPCSGQKYLSFSPLLILFMVKLP